MLVVYKFLQLSSVFSEPQLVLAFLRQKPVLSPVLSPALRQVHRSESSPGQRCTLSVASRLLSQGHHQQGRGRSLFRAAPKAQVWNAGSSPLPTTS